MSVVFLDVSGPAPPPVCWERYAVPANWPRWAPQIHAVLLDEIPAGAECPPAWVGAGPGRHAGAAGRAVEAQAGTARAGRLWVEQTRAGADEVREVRIVPGLRGRVRALVPPAVRFVVTAVDETERTWSWRVGAGPVWMRLDHGVDPCLDGGTLAWLRITAPGPVVRAYTPVARAALRRLVR